MKTSVETRRRLAIAAGFAAFVGLAVGAAFVLDLLPSFEEKCLQQCKVSGMEGRMAYVYSAGQTVGMGGRGPRECRCYRPGTDSPVQE
jgi:hypothetical protein